MSRIASALTCVVLLSLTTVPNSSADPVSITSGTILATHGSEPVTLTGVPGFSFVGGVIPSEGRVDPFSECNLCLGGSTFSVGANLSDSALPGLVTFAGATDAVGSAASTAGLMLEFFGDAVAPPISLLPAVVTAPFTVSGIFFSTDAGTSAEIFGSGIATVMLHSQPLSSDTDRAWFADQVRYDFGPSTPVPEPATLGTIAFGLAALARSVYRNRGAKLRR